MPKTKSAAKSSAVHEAVELARTVIYALAIAVVIRTLLFQPYTIPSASEEPNLFEGDYIIVSKWSYGYSHHSMIFSPPLFNGRVFFTPPKRGDVVVFKLPRDGDTDYIKRLVGLPGDRIQVRGGKLYINDAELARSAPTPITTHDRDDPSLDQPVGQAASKYIETNPEGRSYATQHHEGTQVGDDTAVYVVPQHCYFMMGDNRDNSLDSRFDPGLAPEDPKLHGCAWDSRVDESVQSMQAGVGFVPEENLVGRAWIVMLSWHKGASLFKPWTWLDLNTDRFLRWIK